MGLDSSMVRAMTHLCDQISALRFQDVDKDCTCAQKPADAIHHLAESLSEEGLKDALAEEADEEEE